MENRSTFLYMIRPTRPGFVEQMLPEEAAAMQAHSAYLRQLSSETTFYLIGPCLDSVLRRSVHPNVEIVIIDNGTRQSDALKVLERAATDKRLIDDRAAAAH